MSAVGKLSAGLAHEVGNPIGIVQGYLELLENDDLTVEERHQFSGRAVKELERVNKMVRQLLDFSRTSSEDNAFVSVGQVCRDAGGVLKSQKISSGIEFTITIYDGEDTAGIGYDDLYQVLLNCSFNAIDAIQERGSGFVGKISILSSLTELNSNPPYMEIQIIDNGIGIPEKELTSVFDPFFTTKDVGKGTGLGLSISYGIIEAVGGFMEIESMYGKGTKVMISLPLVHLSEESKIAKQLITHG
jgi:signal transduction histidine kinase